MTIPDISYLSLTEARTNTLIDGLSGLTDPNLTRLIQDAEDQIDTHVGRQQHHPDDTNTTRVFPRLLDIDDDGDPEIPYLVSKACLRQIEWLYTQWWSDRDISLLPMVQDVAEEDIRGDGSYGVKYGKEGSMAGKASLCAQSQDLLKGFVSRMVAIDVTDPDLVPEPS